MNKRNRIIALGGIIAVAGCAGGGKTAVPAAKPAQGANRPLSTGHLTINPTLLRHASAKRRRPAFVDVIGAGNLSLQITSVTNDGFAFQPAVTCIPLTIGQGSISASMPLYGPSGYLRIQEYSQNTSVCPAAPDALLLADTDSNNESEATSPLLGFGNVEYLINIGTDSAVEINGVSSGPVMLQAVIGGIVLSDTADGSGLDTTFVPNANAAPIFYTASNTNGNFVYAFAADAAGDFTNLSVPGGFTNPVMVPPQTFTGTTLGQTNFPGVFSVQSTGCSFPGSANAVSFTASDFFGNTVATGYLLMNGGYLNSGSC